MYSTAAGATPALSIAARITRKAPSPSSEGAVERGGKKERRYRAGAPRERRFVLALDGGDPADAGRDEHTDARRERRGHLQPRIVDRVLRRGDRVLDEDVHLLDIFFLDER